MRTAPYKNFAFLIFGRVTDYILTLGLFAALARFLGSETLGVYYFARSIAFLIVTLAELGLSRFTISALAGNPEYYRTTFGYLFRLRIVASIAVLLLSVAVLNAVDLDSTVFWSTITLAIGLSLFQLSDLFLDVFRAHEAMKVPVLLSLFQRMAYVGVAFLALTAGYQLTEVLIAFLVTHLIHTLVTASFTTTRFGSPGYLAANKQLPRILADSAPFTVAMLLGVVHGKIGLLLLYHFTDETTIGYYGASMHIIEALLYVAYAVTAVAFPNLVRLYASSQEELMVGFSAIIKLLFLCATPVTYLLLITSESIIATVYGAQFSSSVQILQIAALATMPAFLNAGLIAFLQATGKPKDIVFAMLPSLLINVLTAGFLIPAHGEIGAAIAAVIAEYFLLFAVIFLARDRISIRKLFQDVRKLMLATLIAAVVAVTSSPFGLVALVSIPAVVFLTLLVLLGVFSRNETRWMRIAAQSPLKKHGTVSTDN
jgi:PST family polysaccharide transporter